MKQNVGKRKISVLLCAEVLLPVSIERYILNNSQKHLFCGCGELSFGTITLTQIQPGDILMIETNGNYADGPDHMCRAVSLKGNIVNAINGNDSDSVKRAAYTAFQIHDVCRSAYASAIGKSDVT